MHFFFVFSVANVTYTYSPLSARILFLSSTSFLPPFPVAGVSLPVSCPMLWPLYCPSGLHSSHGPCFSRVSPKGFPSSSLLGRLAGPCFFPDRGTGSHHLSSQSLL